MIELNKEEVMQEAIKKFGIKNQLVQTVQELCELSQVLTKIVIAIDQRKTISPHFESYHEELADVQIMLEQVHLIFVSLGCDSKILKTAVTLKRNAKLLRLKDMLDGKK